MSEKDSKAARLSEEAFWLKAIDSLRKEGYKGIHSVYSGANAAFKKYFNGDPVQSTTRLAAAGKINIRPTKGGVMIYKPGEQVDTADKTLGKMGL